MFIVHGRDKRSRTILANFLRNRCRLSVITLGEQANRGRTIIEKFEQYSRVKYAFVLLTPDDHGSLKRKDQTLQLRARQNVVFECGYLFSRIGRDRIILLRKGDVEIWSDIDGVGYTPFKTNVKECFDEIKKELKDAGILRRPQVEFQRTSEARQTRKIKSFSASQVRRLKNP